MDELLKLTFFVVLVLAFACRLSSAQSETPLNSTNTGDGLCDYSKYSPITMEHIPAETVIKKVSPKYPKLAKRQRVEGSVSVKLLIDERGMVRRSCAFIGDELLRSEAEKAGLQWRFKPGYGLAFTTKRKLGNRRRYAVAYISFTFVLHRYAQKNE